MKTKTMERIVLYTDQSKFELAVQQYGRVADLKMRIKKELKTLLLVIIYKILLQE